MSKIDESITAGMKKAMLAKDMVALGALRGLKAAMQNAQVARGNVHELLPEPEAMQVVRKQIKQREDAIAMYEKAGRAELAEKEKAEIAVLEAFLPREMTEEELRPLVDAVVTELGATSKKDRGRVMRKRQQRKEGRAPGKLLSALVSARLSGERCGRQ